MLEFTVKVSGPGALWFWQIVNYRLISVMDLGLYGLFTPTGVRIVTVYLLRNRPTSPKLSNSGA